MGLCSSSEQIGKRHDLPGKSQRAAITCSFADVPQLHWAHVWFLSGRPSFSFSPALTLSLLLSLAHFAVYITYFLSSILSVRLLSLTLGLCQPVGLSVCVSLFFSWASLASSLTPPSPSLSLKKKNVLVGCAFCRNASSDCILHPHCNNKAGVLLPPPFSSPSFFPFVPQK